MKNSLVLQGDFSLPESGFELYDIIEHMNILLIGSGRTGRAITKELLTLSEIDSLYLFSRTSKSAKSLAYDLDDKKVNVVEDLELVPKLDYVIITLSGMSDEARASSVRKRTNTYQLRQDELKYNLGAFVGLIPFLKDLPLRTKIIVVTNPVDELTNYLYQKLGDDRDIFGFGIQLDQRRFREYLQKDITCIGDSAKMQYPTIQEFSMNADVFYAGICAALEATMESGSNNSILLEHQAGGVAGNEKA